MEDGKFVVTEDVSAPEHRGAQEATPPVIEGNVRSVPFQGPEESEEEDDTASHTNRTDDDVVRDAFNEALRDDHEINGDFEDEEEDRIVWSPPRYVRLIAFYCIKL